MKGTGEGGALEKSLGRAGGGMAGGGFLGSGLFGTRWDGGSGGGGPLWRLELGWNGTGGGG